MRSIREIESVGWGFFLIMLILLAGPGIYVSFEYTYDTTTTGVRILVGFVFAGITAAFVAFFVNEILHRRNLRAHEKARHVERKAKKKQGKKGK